MPKKAKPKNHTYISSLQQIKNNPKTERHQPKYGEYVEISTHDVWKTNLSSFSYLCLRKVMRQ